MIKAGVGYYIIIHKHKIYIDIMVNIIKSIKIEEFYKLLENRK